jgi:S-adenosylmethionine decarboxylase
VKGEHIVADYYGVSFDKLDNEDYLIEVLRTACIKGNLTILAKQSWKFQPQGVTVIYMLAESHCSIHTVPEENKCHIDIYHCGSNGNVYVALNHIKHELQPTQTDVTILSR